MNPHTSSERQDASDFFFTVTELERHDLVSMIFRCMQKVFLEENHFKFCSRFDSAQHTENSAGVL